MDKVELTKEEWGNVLSLMEHGTNFIVQNLSQKSGNVEQIHNVSGVTSSLFSKIRSQIQEVENVNTEN